MLGPPKVRRVDRPAFWFRGQRCTREEPTEAEIVTTRTEVPATRSESGVARFGRLGPAGPVLG